MEKLFNVDITLMFDGKVEVMAETKEEANRIVAEYFSAKLGKCFDGGCTRIKDWDISSMSDDTHIIDCYDN